MKKSYGVVVLACWLVLSFISHQDLSASTAITAYGTITDITYVYGSGGLVNHILVTMDSLDGTGNFVYVCRRPLLSPCTGASVMNQYQFLANMGSFCSVTNKICGEAVISSLTLLSDL